MADDPVPIFTQLIDAHPIPSIATREAARFNNLVEQYTQRFGHKPSYIARAPGRVNLIGEHIDYVLFGVFPAAVEQDVLIACGKRPEGSETNGYVHAENEDPRYTPQSFAPMLKPKAHQAAARAQQEESAAEHVHASTWHLDIDPRQLRWESYVKAGYYGVLQRFFEPKGDVTPEEPVNTDILVTGNVPAGSGLSSSAAMVVASTLAFLAVNDKLDIPAEAGKRRITKGELVEMAVDNEKRVGVNSGGMDQGASVTGLPSSALYINFYPTFSATPVLLPTTRTNPRAIFVCANSLVKSEKVVGARTRYNLRVVETLVAARILARVLDLTPATTNPRFTLREVLSAYLYAKEVKGQAAPALTPENLIMGLRRLLLECESIKPAELRKRFGVESTGEEDIEQLGLTMQEMIAFSGLDEAKFNEVYLSWVDVEATHFQIYKRTFHVLSEALRVLQFRAQCLSSTTDSDGPLPEYLLHNIGKLMNASHESCSQLYECSCPELDELTDVARKAGAYGSRVTGAGWGGCTISLVAEDRAEAFIKQVKENYYSKHFPELGEEELKEVIFATQPSNGAFVFKLED